MATAYGRLLLADPHSELQLTLTVTTSCALIISHSTFKISLCLENCCAHWGSQVSESFWTIILVTPRRKKMKGRLRPHYRIPIASVWRITPRCGHTSFLHYYFFDFLFRFVSDGWQSIFISA
jgi:hypothetical protein